MRKYLTSLGIRHERTAPHTPEQNGKAERDNRTIVECARTLIQAKNLPKFLWAEAVSTAIYTLNRVSKASNDITTTAYEAWTGKIPNLHHMRTFGSKAYMHVPKLFTKKFDARSKKVVGYEGESSNYRLYDPNTKKVVVSRNVVVHEDVSSSGDEYEDREVTLPRQTAEQDEEVATEKMHIEQESPQVESPGSQARQLRDKTTLKKPDRFQANIAVHEIPNDYKEALNSKNKKEWIDAINDELKAHEKNGTWTLTPRKPDMKTIDSKWVFKVLQDEEGEVWRFKARLCARDFQQREGIDYTETFSPVVRYDSLRVLLAITTLEDMELVSFDVRTAFLYGDLTERIYMEVSEGVNSNDSRNGEASDECKSERVVCVLNKALYRLKQAPRCWNNKFKNFLRKFNLKETEADKCVFAGHYGQQIVYLAIFVDDGLIACKSREILSSIIKELSHEFDITIGDASLFVGMQINRDRKRKSTFINQSAYVRTVLKRFGMNEAKAVSVPADPNVILKPVLSENEYESHVPYREIIGSLMFLATVTRPDIAFAVNNLSKFVNKHDKTHWQAAKQVLAYLAGTIDTGIEYSLSGNESKLV